MSEQKKPLNVQIVEALKLTPKRQTARKLPKEPYLLLAFASEHNGRVDLTNPEVAMALEATGLKVARLPNAAYGIRKYFGQTVTTERIGRKVSAYIVKPLDMDTVEAALNEVDKAE